MSVGTDSATSAVFKRLGELCPVPLHLMSLLGEPVDERYVAAFCDRYGEDWLALLVDPGSAPERFEGIWRHVHGREQWELLELLLCEHWMSMYPRRVERTLRHPMRFDKTLHTVRGAIAVALYSRAKSVNWREPLTFVRALRVAEVYLVSVVENAELTKEETRAAFEGRLGVCRVLQSRYVNLPAAALHGAISSLEHSIGSGNVAIESHAYLGEALLRSYDESGDPNQLTKLINHHRNLDDKWDSPALRATVAEAWLRLSDIAAPARSVEYARNAETAALSLQSEPDAVLYARGLLVRAIVDAKRTGGSGLPVRGLRLPFGLKRSLRDWAQADSEFACSLAQQVVTLLADAPTWRQTDPICRRIDASARSMLGEILPSTTSPAFRAAWIESAVEKRSSTAGRSRLSDPESGLENCLDLFKLRNLKKQDEATLVAALESALLLADFDQAWPTPLIVLARELDTWDRGLSAPAIYRLRQLRLQQQEIRNRVIAGDAPGLYQIAAERALASREIDRRHLGGRTGVYLAEDYSGVLQDHFVFKPTTVSLADREDDRIATALQRIDRLGLSARWQLPQTMARSVLPAGDPLRGMGYELIVARQYHSGAVLCDYISGCPREVGQETLHQAVGFLALLHTNEPSEPYVGQRMRAQLWKKEFGRWLRAVRIDDRSSLFALWWSIFDHVPCFERRDAHPLNWIVTPNRSIIALDFEASGWRPAGYELAQLTDDSPLIELDTDGWRIRKRLLREYRNRLASFGVDIPPSALRHAYEAALIARATRLITDPNAVPRSRDHGVRLLRYLRQNATTEESRSIAAKIHEAWLVRLGVASIAASKRKPISEARRRHLSRAMAYELRHGDRVSVDEFGWAPASELTVALNGDGLRTEPAELMSVASAIDEPRFEVESGRIRARYGHTRQVHIEYSSSAGMQDLFHGTAVTNLNAIFGGQGLRSMGRLWVHLSCDPTAAIRTAKRHGPSVLLQVNAESVTETIYAAGGPVHLTKSVPPEALRIVTPTQLFLMGQPSADA